MASACGQKPDHSTIAAFISSMGEEVAWIYTQVLLVCEEEVLQGGAHFSLDGLELSSDASKEWSGTFKDLEKKQANQGVKVKEAIRAHREADKREGKKDESERQRREKRISRLKKQAERIAKFLSQSERKKGAGGKEIGSNVTDNESAKMVTSHGVIQGYSANALVDERRQVIVHAQVFGDGQNESLAGPMLEGARRNLDTVGWEEALRGK